MSTSSPAANRPLTQAVMAWLVSTPLALSAAGDMQVVELPLTLPVGIFTSSLMSANGSVVIGRLENGMAGLWQADSGVIELGDYLPRAVNRWGTAVLLVAGDGLGYVYDRSNGTTLPVPTPDGAPFTATALDSVWKIHGTFVNGTPSSWTQSEGFQVVPGIATNLLPAQVMASTDQTNWSVVLGVLQGATGKRGFVHLKGFFGVGSSVTSIVNGPGGSEAWVWGVSRHGHWVVGQVPLPGDGPTWQASIPNRACLWAVGESGYTPALLAQPPGMLRSDARATSEWADVVVGTATAPGVGYRAIVWASGAPIDLTRHLQCADVDTPTLEIARAVSDNGTTILATAGLRLYLVTGFTPTAYSPADLNMDGVTNGIDLAMLLTVWGNCSAPCDADINGDGFVEGKDLAELLSRWGSCS